MGGAETWLLECVKHLNDHPDLNLQFDFLLTGGVESIFDDEIRKYGAKTFYKKYSLSNYFSFSTYFRKLLREEKFDVIHNHEDFVSGWHYLSAITCLPKLRIAHLHNPYNYVRNYITGPGRFLVYKLGRILTVLFSNKITGTSNAVMNEYGYDKWPYSAKRIQPLYCGLDPHKFEFSNSKREKIRNELGWNFVDTKIAIFVGRIGLKKLDQAKNQKNPEFAFEIAKKLISNYPDWNFVFAGLKGDYGDLLEKEVIKLGISERIKFVGIQNNISEWMSASDTMVFPAYWEGLGMVLVEAQCNGLPVVVSNTIPSEAFVNHNLVNVLELEDSSISWMNMVVEKKASASINRLQAKSFIENSNFSISNSISNMTKVYKGAIK